MGSIISICRGLCILDAIFGRNNSHKAYTASTDSYVIYSKLKADKEQIEGLIFLFCLDWEDCTRRRISQFTQRPTHTGFFSLQVIVPIANSLPHLIQQARELKTRGDDFGASI
jgi:hypothetical protein